MVVSVGAVASPSQGVSYYERDGYYAKDDPEHLGASAWAGKGAAELGLEGPVDPDTFKAVLEGRVPDGTGQRLGRVDRDGILQPGVLRDAPEDADTAPGKGAEGAAEAEKPPAAQAAEWAVAHLAEREAVFTRSDLLAATLAWGPGEVSIGSAGKAVDDLIASGSLHKATALESGEGLTTEKALADERETIGLMREGQTPNSSTRCRSGWRTGERWNSSGAIRNCATSTTPGPRPCTRSRAAPWTT